MCVHVCVFVCMQVYVCAFMRMCVGVSCAELRESSPMTVFHAKKEMTIPFSTVVVLLYAIDILTCHTYVTRSEKTYHLAQRNVLLL